MQVAGLLGLVVSLGLANPASAGICPNIPDVGVSVYLLDTNSTLYVLQPGEDVFEPLGQVSGLKAGEQLIGIDFRPANGLLYGFSDRSNLYQITLPDDKDVEGPAAGLVSSFPSFPSLGYSGGFQSLMDFNPVADAIRLIGSNDENYAIVNANGGTLNQLVAQTNVSYPQPQPPSRIQFDADITAGAYSNNFAGATTTLFYMLDYQNDALVTIADLTASGSSNTAGGKLRALGLLVTPTNEPINIPAVAGLDIYTTDKGENIGIAVIGQSLYCINDLDKIYVGQKRPIASEAPVKTDRNVGLYLDVAVALFEAR